MANEILTAVISLIISGIFSGIGICIGIFLIGRRFVRDIVKQMPEWIREVMHENIKNSAISKATNARKSYS